MENSEVSPKKKGGRISKLFKFIHRELHEEGAYLVPLRLFIGIGWLRACVEKILERDWWTGDALEEFLHGQIEENAVKFPIYENIIYDYFLPNVLILSWVVIIGQLLVGISILTGTFTNLGLLSGLFMNFNFVLAGRVTPSAFYIVIQLVLFVGNTGSTLGMDTLISNRIPFSFIVAQNDYKRKYLKIEKYAFLWFAFSSFVAAGYSFFFITDFDPNSSVEDPAMLLFILGQIIGLTFIIDYLRLQPYDVVPPKITSPSDFVINYGDVGNYVEWLVYDENPDHYHILENGKEVESGSWIDKTRITYLLDHLPIGNHRVVLTIQDWAGNSNSDAVDVTVSDPTMHRHHEVMTLLQLYRESLQDRMLEIEHSINVNTSRIEAVKKGLTRPDIEYLPEKKAKYVNEIARLNSIQSFLKLELEDIQNKISRVDESQIEFRQEGYSSGIGVDDTHQQVESPVNDEAIEFKGSNPNES